MKHKINLISLALVFVMPVTAQTPSKQHYIELYKRGVKYNDPQTAITALNGYLTLGEDEAYKDTLSILYYLKGEYFSSLLLTAEVYAANSNNVNALERMATCYDQLGDIKLAAENFEKLSVKTKNPYHYYKLATAQYQLKRIAECRLSLQKVMADTASRSIPISFDNGNGQSQNIPILAGAYNMLAVMEMDVKNYENARLLLNRAVEAFPDFVGAKQNLAALDKLTNKNNLPKQKPKAKPGG